MTAPPREPDAWMYTKEGQEPCFNGHGRRFETYGKEWTEVPLYAAPAPSAEPPAQAATERMGTHWETCATDGGPRHYDCALRLIEQQAREIAELRADKDAYHYERAERAESALAARDAALTLIMRNADAAKEPCGTDPESAAAIRNGKLASLAQIAAQVLGLVRGPDLIDAARAKVKP